MPQNLTTKLIGDHLVDGNMQPGEEIHLRIDQTLTQDATGTLVMLELESMGIDRVQTQASVQYVDHNLIQADSRNPDDHRFLESACRRLGVWYSRPGNGISHPVHQQRFGAPGKTLLGSDSHTPAAGALGMLAIGAGGLDVARAMAGFPFMTQMPEVFGIKLTGQLPERVSAKDMILELLRRHDVDGAVGCVLEYFGPGLSALTAMDRHVIANMGTELGATSTVFPADDEVRRFLKSQGREKDWQELLADEDCAYNRTEEIDLSTLEPLIAMPSSPGNVRPVREVAGEPISQAYIGSSANPGYRDFAVAAEIVRGQTVPSSVSFDINPTSRQLLAELIRDGHLASLINAGARLHQAGCNGCIGMGQAPPTDSFSLRTVPRNFPGRSGTKDDRVCLVSPETAAASALTGVITDPTTLEGDGTAPYKPENVPHINDKLLEAPLSAEAAEQVELVKGPGIISLPDFEQLPDELELPVLLKVEDDVSTDEILPAGARVLPYRSNIPAISQFCFEPIDESYAERAEELREQTGHAVVAGSNYGQGSSREHAALGPRFLGLRVVLAKSFGRIHRQNLVNFGILPLTFEDHQDYDELRSGSTLQMSGLRSLEMEEPLVLRNVSEDRSFPCRHDLSQRQIEILLAGGLINLGRREARLQNSSE